MSDGGKETGELSETRKPSGNEDFVRAIAKIAVTQLCENEGFQGFHHSALEALADVAVRYIKELGEASIRYANDDNRSECNVFDVVRGLEDLGLVQGFPGASNVHRSVSKSGMVKEVSQYVGLVEEIPFLFSLPKFPVSKERGFPSSFLQIGTDPPEHIPPWLPAFPERESSVSGEGEADAQKEAEVSRKEEVELMNVQQQQQSAAYNGTEVFETNPFLARPFAYGEKPVSSVEFPTRHWEGNHINVMDTFAPEAETARKEVSEIEETDKHVKVDERPAVRFKLSSARKSSRVCRNVAARRNEVEKVAVFFERDDENDEKKRRAGQILKDSMETPLDTTEL